MIMELDRKKDSKMSQTMGNESWDVSLLVDSEAPQGLGIFNNAIKYSYLCFTPRW